MMDFIILQVFLSNIEASVFVVLWVTDSSWNTDYPDLVGICTDEAGGLGSTLQALWDGVSHLLYI